MKKTFVFFDFDGVIADSFRTALEIQKKICPHLTEPAYRKRFEDNINNWESPHHGHTTACRHDIDFFTEYIPKMHAEVRIIPGIKEVIITLEERHNLTVISSTLTHPIKKFLKQYDLVDRFVRILGNDVHVSKIEKINMLFEEFNIRPHQCVFITDTLGDMREAEFARVGTIGISWGFHTIETLRRGNPFRLVETPNDLLSAVSDYFVIEQKK